MNWNLFWGFYILIFGVACWICAYVFGFRKMNKEKRCSKHVIGRVIGLSAIYYGDVHIPRVQYELDGRAYKVSGPKFLSGSVVSIHTPFNDLIPQIETNLTTRENLPKKLKVRIHGNSFISAYNSPLYALYPKDSEVDVYYNPNKPKESFVQRYEGVNMALVIMMVSMAVLITIGSLFVFFGPTIVMH